MRAHNYKRGARKIRREHLKQYWLSEEFAFDVFLPLSNTDFDEDFLWNTDEVSIPAKFIKERLIPVCEQCALGESSEED